MIGIGVNISPFLNKVARTVANYYNRVISDGATIESLECVNTNLSQLDSKNLLDSASLVMIPSGYKEDIVYSEVPSSNAGDLSFTRASDGTRINSAGLVEVVPWNLVQQSNVFNTTWTIGVNTTVTSGFSDPFGGSNAWRLTMPNTTGTFLQQAFTFDAVPYTFSVWAKSNGNTNLTLQINGSSEIAYVLTNEWQRITLTYTPTVGASNVGIGNGVSSVDALIYGAQLNIGSTAKPYFPTTDRLNVPRLTYQNGGGGCPSLLLEKQSTNLVVQSNDMTTWTNGGARMTKNATTSPDGTNNALSFDNSGGCSTFVSASNGVHAWSLFVKQGTSATASIDMSDGATGDVITTFTFATKTFSGTSAGGSWTSPSTSYIDLGNGWYRITLIGTKNAGSLIGHTIIASGSGYTYVYGAQLEASSYPTSYIPTTSASATRVKDAIGNQTTSIAQAFTDNSKGTVFFDLRNIKIGGADAARFRFGDSSSSLQFALYIGPIGVGVYSYKATAGFVISQSTTSAQKLAVKFDGNTIVGFSNGVKRNTITASSSFSIDQMTDNDTGDLCWEKNQFILFNAVLTDAECISLTTI